MRSLIYGPVSSWRLGKSLGIDVVSSERKACSFDCVYCQLGETANPLVQRRGFVSIDEIESSLRSVQGLAADYATFSGMGEPTLASNLGEAIELAGSILRLPVAVLTNSSLMVREDVCRELAQADVVVAKVDAPNEELFRQINKPFVDHTLDDILQALKSFRRQYQGKLALQIMFMEANASKATEMAAVAREILPDEVQVNTPLRPCPVTPLPPEELASIGQEFTSVARTFTVYEAEKKAVVPIHLTETLRRRPVL
jgi:wyosine [tRNA(Phe)-imidazoG37] synthetase (radical SAM superfamily)